MRYVLLSDVHANRPALEAVLGDLASVPGVDASYHLGDLVGYGPWPNEVVEMIATAGIAGVAGNYDSTVARGYAHCGCRSEDPRQEALAHLSYEWTRERVSPRTRTWLGGLPFRIDLRPLGGHVAGPTVILVHGGALLNTVYVEEGRSDAFLSRMAASLGAQVGDVVCFGHTHKPWHRVSDGIHFINTGSVGRPKDGDWRGAYVRLDVEVTGVRCEVVRVAYDIEETARAIASGGLPTEFAEYLRTGGAAPLPANG